MGPRILFICFPSSWSACCVLGSVLHIESWRSVTNARSPGSQLRFPDLDPEESGASDPCPYCFLS